MSVEITYISDFFSSQVLGGGELNDDVLLDTLIEQGHQIKKINSSNVQLSDINNRTKFIVSNFVNLNKQLLSALESNCSYVIYEHDHKYLTNRNPAAFKDFLAPKNYLINQNFYKSAKKVICQSSFHQNIVKKNLDIKNIYNVSGNLWSDESLDLMSNLLKFKKKDCYSILKSLTEHKNTRECVDYCRLKGFDYELISSNDYSLFLKKLSQNNKFLFLPKTPETLSRVVVESKMMGVKAITNKNVGATYENWFNKSGEDLIEIMRDKKKEISLKIMEFLHE